MYVYSRDYYIYNISLKRKASWNKEIDDFLASFFIFIRQLCDFVARDSTRRTINQKLRESVEYMVTELGDDFPKTWQPENGFRNEERETVLVLDRTEAALLIFCRRVRCFPCSSVSQTRFQRRRRTLVKNLCARLLWYAVKNICRKPTSRRVVITMYKDKKEIWNWNLYTCTLLLLNLSIREI